MVTIGAYDGVHLGHRHSSAGRAAEAAAARRDLGGGHLRPPPGQPCAPRVGAQLLTDLDQKLELLAATGVGPRPWWSASTESRAEETAEDFVRTVLVECLRARSVVVGEDFHFGHGRRGNVALLAAMGAELGFDVTGIPPPRTDGRRATARLVDPDPAAWSRRASRGGGGRCSGRPTRSGGSSATATSGAGARVPDRQRGGAGEICLPADGVYAGWYRRPDGSRHPAAISLGRRPTFYEDAELSLLEAHLLDFDGDLYGETGGGGVRRPAARPGDASSPSTR